MSDSKAKHGHRLPKTKRRQLIPARKCVILRERCALLTTYFCVSLQLGRVRLLNLRKTAALRK
jgi:hypothetical protein